MLAAVCRLNDAQRRAGAKVRKQVDNDDNECKRRRLREKVHTG